MKITWYGHACFGVECEEGSVVFDPYSPGSVPGLELPELTADAVSASHSHGDHCALECVRLSGRPAKLALRSTEVFHDDCGGAKRGKNKVTVLQSEGITLAHMGDLGHELTKEQQTEIGRADLLMVPVGGFFTIDAATALKTAEQLQAKWILPMHYRMGKAGLQMVAGLEEFLKLWKGPVVRLPGSSAEFTEETAPGVYVFTL